MSNIPQYSVQPDPALDAVRNELLRLDPDGARFGRAVRRTYDMIYNGQETGRFRWADLAKTEKTHFGTLFEINIQREFAFEDGDQTDFRIASHQVDAKWSQTTGRWMLPPEVFGELALVATASDERAVWSVGLVRVRPEFRALGSNRDEKSQLNDLGRRSVEWLWKDAPLRPNVLLQLSANAVRHIFDHRAGTQKTHRLFRAAEGMIVHRNAVATVSRQLDAQKRVRYNGGSRSALQPEGYIILSGAWNYHRYLAEQLGVPIPLADEYVSARLVPDIDASKGIELEGILWRRANEAEVSALAAPRIAEPPSGKSA